MIDRVDVFVFLDDVQFIKREWKNRNKIRKTADGEDTKWLTVPIVKGRQKSLIKNAQISLEWDWVLDHSNRIHSVYRYAKYFDKYYLDIKGILLEYSKGTLSDLNINITKYICGELGIKTKLIKSSDINATGKREERLLNICKSLGADYYLANNATGGYVTAKYFQKQDIKFVLQNYKHPEYPQYFKNKLLGPIPFLSVVDLLCNCGNESLEIIRKGKLDKALNI